MKQHEREFVADIIEWSLQTGIQTLRISAYIQTDPKSVEKGTPHLKRPMFSCEYVHMVEGNWKSKKFEAPSVEELRFLMGKVMHELWEEPVGDLLAAKEEVDADLASTIGREYPVMEFIEVEEEYDDYL